MPRVLERQRHHEPVLRDHHVEIRGANVTAGFWHNEAATAAVRSADGWLDTGDLGRLDTRGYVRITGRSKDVIIRGGENIPVVEIEALLYRHPAVAQAAIVAFADARLGERGCAVIVPKPGQSLDLAGMVEFLKSQKVALQYIPERLMLLEAMPATPSGKIQKFKLREMLRESAA